MTFVLEFSICEDYPSPLYFRVLFMVLNSPGPSFPPNDEGNKGNSGENRHL